MNLHAFTEKFYRLPIVGIMRNIPGQLAESIALCYAEAGFTSLEITMNSAGAAETIAALANTHGSRLNIGAGTVLNLTDLDSALNAGATFIVTPVLVEEVISACKAQQIPIFPGAYTPSEIYRAWQLGATAVKVFPAGKLGPGYLREVLAPLNNLKLMPTGGITPDNFTDYLAAGACAVGMGNYLFPPQLVENARWDELKALYAHLIQSYTHYKLQDKQHV